jgi:hypothetical protein
MTLTVSQGWLPPEKCGLGVLDKDRRYDPTTVSLNLAVGTTGRVGVGGVLPLCWFGVNETALVER